MKKIVVIGGGTGTYTVLTGIKDDPYEVSAVVSMMDRGGSTGRLRDQFGVLPPGDVRQCLVALSDAPDLWRKLFLFRFSNGDFEGHNFGNIFLTALEKVTSNYQEVIDQASYILQTKGEVIPVTFDKVHLCATYDDGETLVKEELIDNAIHKKNKIIKAFLEPSAQANQRALKAISEADYIIIGPGDIYTSLIPNLLVTGIKEALVTTQAKIINFVNLMTKAGQSTDYSALDHLKDLEKYIGRPFDHVFINNGQINDDIIMYYEKYNEKIVKDDLPHNDRFIRTDLVADITIEKIKGDRVTRSIIRHDSKKVALAIQKLLHSQ